MFLLTDRWRSGYAPYHCHRGQVRIRVAGWIRLARLEDAFIEPESRLRKIVDYLRLHGVVQTWRKVRSRLAERHRNARYVAFGWGRTAGTERRRVIFLAPFHPACVDEVCVDERLVRDVGGTGDLPERDDTVLSGEMEISEATLLAGWSRFSGLRVDAGLVARILDRCVAAAATSELPSLQALPVEQEQEGLRAHRSRPTGEKPTAVLFGLGHYAKNIVLPRVAPHLHLSCIHEIDPVQVGPVADRREEVRTSAHPEPDEHYDVYLVAGYHHTHASIAAHGLRQGAAVVVEKPPVTSRRQLAELTSALQEGEGRLFVAYQRRYSKFHDYLQEDLGTEDGRPVHCQAVVHEIPLPARHWYRWPISGSRLLSNGCHWIDHFLHLNDLSEPARVTAARLANGDVVATVELENQAALTLVITDHGSSRLGVRDVVKFRAGGVTATVIDQRLYQAENRHRSLRRDQVRGRHPYDRMYSAICRRIVDGASGDSLLSLRVGCEALLLADEALAGEMGRGSR